MQEELCKIFVDCSVCLTIDNRAVFGLRQRLLSVCCLSLCSCVRASSAFAVSLLSSFCVWASSVFSVSPLSSYIYYSYIISLRGWLYCFIVIRE